MTRRHISQDRRSNRRPPARRPTRGRATVSATRPEIDWEKLCKEMKPDIDFPAILELQATLGRLPAS
jgi:DNA-binding transcriptional regulator YdaS (Cro superfamily)